MGECGCTSGNQCFKLKALSIVEPRKDGIDEI